MKRATFVKVAVVLSTAYTAAVGADRPGVSFEVTPLTQYVWRGLAIGSAPVLQTSTTLSYRGARLNAFTNQELTHTTTRRGVLNELDFDIGYDYVGEKITLSGGVIRYTFPNTQAASTTEWYAGAASATFLHPSVRLFKDVDAIHGQYVTVDGFHSVALPRFSDRTSWEAVLSAGVGWGSANHNAVYYGVNRSGLADLHPSFALPVTRGRWRIISKAGYAMMLSPALREGPASKMHGFFTSVTAVLTL